MPHHVSQKHPQMSRRDRAAQFAPFAALTGHGAAVQETARLTQRRIELDENSQEELNTIMRQILSLSGERPQTDITYFVPDERKEGGRYETVRGVIQNIDTYRHQLVMTDGLHISIEEILSVEVV
ncbi:MAG: hypothetical protein Q4B57_09120 [Eubacteriales bacterium]|nr:hypothetical protein [Eubacteriales bacterium]